MSWYLFVLVADGIYLSLGVECGRDIANLPGNSSARCRGWLRLSQLSLWHLFIAIPPTNACLGGFHNFLAHLMRFS